MMYYGTVGIEWELSKLTAESQKKAITPSLPSHAGLIQVLPEQPWQNPLKELVHQYYQRR